MRVMRPSLHCATTHAQSEARCPECVTTFTEYRATNPVSKVSIRRSS